MKPRLPFLLASLTPAALHAETLVAGWDSFSSVTNPPVTQEAADTTASMTTSGTGGNWDDWNNNLFGASTDGTFGNLSTTVASASTDAGTGSNQGTNLSLNRSRKPGTITLTNDSTEDRLMGGFYFDGIARFSQSAPDWTLTFSGAISGTAASGTLVSANMMSATPEQRDQEVDLTSLTDHVWEAGTDAIFTLSFSGGDPSTGTGGGQETCIDNIGITVVPAPSGILKDNNADDLNLGTSWVGGSAPVSPDFAIWDNTVAGANTTVLGADQAWGGIAVEDPGGPVTIDSGNTLTLDGTTFAIDLSAATADLTLNNALVIDGNSSWNIGTGRTATAAGVISGGSGIDKQSDGTVVLSGANTYAGDTAVTAGTLQLGAAEVIPHGGGGGASGNVTIDGTLDLNGFSETLNGLSGSGVIDTLSGGTPTLEVGHNGASGTFSGTPQNTSGTLSLSKFGTGNLVLGGANTYSGTTTILDGSLEIENLAALGNTSGITLSDGAEFVPDLDGLVVTAPITLGGIGTTSSISVPINGPGNGGDIIMTLDGAISGDGNLVFTDLGGFGNNTDGIIVLGAASTYTGTTTIATGALIGNNTIIRSGVANALPTTTVLSLEGINGTGSGRKVIFDLNGNDQTLAGLQNVGQTDRQQRVTSSAAATLTVDNTGDFSFGAAGGGNGEARIQGAISLVKSGTGKFTLIDTHTYSGATTVDEGTLSFDGSSLASSVTVSSGASVEFRLGLPASTSGSLDLGTGTVKIDGVTDGSSDYLLMTATGGVSGTLALDVAVPDYQLELRNGDTELWLAVVASGFADWATTGTLGPVTFEGDTNGDGVQDGIAFLLGVANPDDDANAALPAVTEDGSGGLQMTFDCLPIADRGTASLHVQHSSDLANWTPSPTGVEVPDLSGGPTDSISFAVTPGSPLNTVTVTIDPVVAAGGRLFGRLRGIE